MLRRMVALLALALGVCACGSSGDGEPAAPAGATTPARPDNRPPTILAVDLYPDDPSVEHTLSVSLEVQDPDRDALDVELEWLRNGVAFRSGPETSLAASEFVRGDEIMARVHVRDAQYEVSADSDTVRVRNQPPRMTALDLLPEHPNGAESLMAVARAVDPEDDEVRFEYRWLRNGKPLAGATESTLSADQFGRGDEIRVEVRPSDSDDEGSWTSSTSLRVGNAPPQIVSKPSYELRTPGLYAYSIHAEDPDGDEPLRYELVDGPRGMKVDLVTGELSWRVPDDAQGNYEIEVAVTDPQGASARQRYAIDVRWDEPSSGVPAAPSPSENPSPNAPEEAPAYGPTRTSKP